MAKILLVDDQESFLLTLEQILSAHQHMTERTNNAFDALEMLKINDYDLMITDAIMPGRTGYDLITAVRKTQRISNLPIIMLTGKRGIKDVSKSILAGVNEYVFKPVDPKILIAKIDLLLLKNNLILLDLKSASVTYEASWKDQTTITEVSQAGLVILSNVFIGVGTTLKITSEIFSEIGISNLSVTVADSVPDQAQKKLFKIKALFVNATRNDHQKILDWIDSKTAKKAS